MNMQATLGRQRKPRIDPDYSIATVDVDEVMLWITLEDGRVVGTPLAWWERLETATEAQRANWILQSGKTGIHWPDIDEDISVLVLMGHPS